jgi:hypothetical protein
MLTQAQLIELNTLKARIKADEVRVEQLTQEIISGVVGLPRDDKNHVQGVEVEPGTLTADITYNPDAERTSWKDVVARIKKLHKQLSGGIALIEKGYTKIVGYRLIAIKPVERV